MNFVLAQKEDKTISTLWIEELDWNTNPGENILHFLRNFDSGFMVAAFI